MGMNILLSGAMGAVVAAAIAILYQHISLIEKRRFDLTVLTTDYIEEIVNILTKLEMSEFDDDTVASMKIGGNEFKILSERAKSLIQSSVVEVRISLVYGWTSDVYSKFNKLRGLLGKAHILITSKESPSHLQKYNTLDLFVEEINPLRVDLLFSLEESASLKYSIRDTIAHLFNPVLIVVGFLILIFASYDALSDNSHISGQNEDVDLKLFEINAKEQKTGIWADPASIPPWECRSIKR